MSTSLKIYARILFIVFLSGVIACDTQQETLSIVVIKPCSCSDDKRIIGKLHLLSAMDANVSLFTANHCANFSTNHLQKEPKLIAFRTQKQKQAEKIIAAISNNADVLWAAKRGIAAQYTFGFFEETSA